MNDKPWTEPGISKTERALRVIRRNRDFNGMADQRETIVEAIETAVADLGPKWNKIEDGLPDVGEMIFMALDGGIELGCYTEDGQFKDVDSFQLRRVTHWQYVVWPESPKE